MGKKFDFVIGNPPYQIDMDGNNNQAKPVYNLFMDEAFKIAEKVELITPARFLSEAGATPKKWNKQMLASKNLKVLKYFKNSNEVFSGVDIKGGVVITFYDSKGEFEPIGTFIDEDSLRSIYQKTKKESSVSNLGDFVRSPDSYRFTDEMFREHPEVVGRTDKSHAKAVASSVFERYPEIFSDQKESNSITVIGRKNNSRLSLNTKGHYLNDPGNLKKWKLLVAGAIGTGRFGETLSEFEIAPPNAAHTQSFLSMGEFNTEEEVKALAKYLKTKFARALLGIMKKTQNNQSKVVWSKIPQQDFSSASDVDWSKPISEIDQQLYKKYDLSPEEIEFIETNVKEMN